MFQLQTPAEAAHWLRSRVTGSIQTDSRKVQPGDGFIAWPGAATDARVHVAGAFARGAAACLVEQEGIESYPFSQENTATYLHLKKASGLIAAAYLEQPSHALDVIAVTGTNGKTSTVWWLAQALSHLKQTAPIPCAMVGTLGVGQPPSPDHAGLVGALDAMDATGLTTPDPVRLQQTFRDCADAGIKACAIEASSIGIEEHRLAGTRIHTAIFTNFTQDHLDYHGSMEAYWQAKASLFQWQGLQSVVINMDDVQGSILAASFSARVLDVWTFSCEKAARLQACDLSYEPQGLCFTVMEASQCHRVQTRMMGDYNVSNLLGVMAAMRSLGVPLAAIVDSCHRLTPVPGRMECINTPEQPLVAVDYAHTPDALSKALAALRPLAKQRGGALWCVFGCGGDRDTHKRPLMGAIAARHADHLIVTSDNPRSERPDVIHGQILGGIQGHRAVTVQSDRGLAIFQAIAQAAPADVVLIAGKGHEDYQETEGVRLPFSDMDHVHRALNHRAPQAFAGSQT